MDSLPAELAASERRPIVQSPGLRGSRNIASSLLQRFSAADRLPLSTLSDSSSAGSSPFLSPKSHGPLNVWPGEQGSSAQLVSLPVYIVAKGIASTARVPILVPSLVNCDLEQVTDPSSSLIHFFVKWI